MQNYAILSELIGFWTLCPSSCILKFREHNVSETGSVSEEYHLLGYDAR
jgi:hypothetical protein